MVKSKLMLKSKRHLIHGTKKKTIHTIHSKRPTLVEYLRKSIQSFCS